MDRYGLLESDVNPSELEQFIDDMFVDPSWRRWGALQGEILHNNLQRLADRIHNGDWVVLKEISASSALVDWIDAPEAPDGGYWQVNRAGLNLWMGSSLQWQLNQAYRQRRAMAQCPPPIPLP
ncbi:hypothetical protein, partial [Trinickia mobilis]|uniref:hypothetical protein n=1 Tax=Trinickia mobilis TaxID=2816356 RepID=UPI001A901375